MRDVHLCSWCGVQIAPHDHDGTARLCPDCEEARESDAVRYFEGPKEDAHDL